MAKQTKKNNATHLLTALALIVIGVVGLLLVSTSEKAMEALSSTTGKLRVIDSTGNSPHDRAGDAAQELQGAARTKDLLQGRDGENVQPGASVDDLLEDTEIR